MSLESYSGNVTDYLFKETKPKYFLMYQLTPTGKVGSLEFETHDIHTEYLEGLLYINAQLYSDENGDSYNLYMEAERKEKDASGNDRIMLQATIDKVSNIILFIYLLESMMNQNDSKNIDARCKTINYNNSTNKDSEGFMVSIKSKTCESNNIDLKLTPELELYTDGYTYDILDKSNEETIVNTHMLVYHDSIFYAYKKDKENVFITVYKNGDNKHKYEVYNFQSNPLEIKGVLNLICLPIDIKIDGNKDYQVKYSDIGLIEDDIESTVIYDATRSSDEIELIDELSLHRLFFDPFFIGMSGDNLWALDSFYIPCLKEDNMDRIYTRAVFEVESEEDNEKLKSFIKDRKYDKSRPLFHYNLSMYEDKFEVKAKK